MGSSKKTYLSRIPYWYTLKAYGFLNEKHPGGMARHKELLEKNGNRIIGRGKKYRVAGYERFLTSQVIKQR
ncbi:MAG: hypothetical protein HPY46_04940 [Candidatus Aminicenantes bacterium]|nr:hypothetical protein [Candidatus Aminicenantes bacterium]